VGIGARAARIGVGAVAGALLAPPITPKLDGASVSRAASRVRGVAVAEPAATPGSGAVPLPVRAAAGAGAAAGADGAAGSIPELPEGLPAPRTGAGGGPSLLPRPAGRGAGRGGGLGDSVKSGSGGGGLERRGPHAPPAVFEEYKEIGGGG
jgi:hypothetical protein